MSLSNFYEKYRQEILPAVGKTLGITNINQVPGLKKVVLNVGVGRFVKEPNFVETVENTLKKITGQKPVRTKAKKSISNFKIREGMEIGVMVTLRGPKMFHFIEKLVRVVLPRTKDFHGLSDKSFDNGGNYTLGFKENLAFPEIRAEDVDKMHGLQIIINTSAKNKEAGKTLLAAIGLPFVK